jgi:hypothetical protein
MRIDRREIRVLSRRRGTPLKDIDDVFRVAVARLENRGQAECRPDSGPRPRQGTAEAMAYVTRRNLRNA